MSAERGEGRECRDSDEGCKRGRPPAPQKQADPRNYVTEASDKVGPENELDCVADCCSCSIVTKKCATARKHGESTKQNRSWGHK
ncbi:MAG: hypothetical protein O9320_09850 [Magnetospirillum sp.]|nr:hypothetical protein [Magnetospirillum sp.]